MLTIRQVVHGIAHKWSGGLEQIREYLNQGKESKTSLQVLINKLNPNSTNAHFYIEELDALCALTNSHDVMAEYHASKCNLICIRVPELPVDGDMEMLDVFMGIMKELGDVSTKFQTAYSDGDISKSEYEQISKEIDDVLSKLLEFKAAVRRVSR